MSSAEAFLAAHAIVCAPMHARISRVQCGVNIKGGDVPYCAVCPEASSADMSGPDPVTGWGRKHSERKTESPAGVQKEIPMPEDEKHDYTLADIAKLAGINPDCIWGAMKYVKSGNLGKSKNAAKVQRALDDLGITWRDVKNVRGKHECGQEATEPKRGTAINQDFETAIAQTPTACPPDEPETDALDQIVHELAAEDLRAIDQYPEHAAPAPYTVPRPNYAADFSGLGHIPLEALVTEITRRMPRAEVVLR